VYEVLPEEFKVIVRDIILEEGFINPESQFYRK
jgi:hypothetical protein